jgi:hypothetical protein
MAYPKSRSASAELHQGMVDGTYKQVSPNRGGDIDPATYEARRDLSDVWTGIHEAVVKELPDARPAVTPTFCPTPPAQPSAV